MSNVIAENIGQNSLYADFFPFLRRVRKKRPIVGQERIGAPHTHTHIYTVTLRLKWMATLSVDIHLLRHYKSNLASYLQF